MSSTRDCHFPFESQHLLPGVLLPSTALPLFLQTECRRWLLPAPHLLLLPQAPLQHCVPLRQVELVALELRLAVTMAIGQA